MIKKLFLLLLTVFIPLNKLLSQPAQVEFGGKRIYSIGILEMSNDDRRAFNDKFNEQSRQHENNRGIFMESLLAANRSSLLTKVTTTAEGVLNAGLARLTEDFKSPRGKWEKAVMQECRFSKSLGMVEEIKDFYSDVSKTSPLDAENIVFNGFTCRQDIKIGDDTCNVFYVSCKLDKSKINRMIAHSKFEVYVDSVRFNPYNCDIPNDSLQDITKRIAFDFRNRNDLRLRIHATVTSSWINEAVMIFNNEKLGEFDIEIKIDSNIVLKNPERVYTYKAGKNIQQAKDISVRGESFVVPRSYSGNDRNGNSIWGTGQYKIDMHISETCQINQSYYTKGNGQASAGQIPMTASKGEKQKIEWNDNWEQEWKLINSREKSTTFWQEAWAVIKTNWTGSEWLTELTSPTTSYFIKEGSTALNGGVVLDKYKQGMTGDTTGAQGSGAVGPMP